MHFYSKRSAVDWLTPSFSLDRGGHFSFLYVRSSLCTRNRHVWRFHRFYLILSAVDWFPEFKPAWTILEHYNLLTMSLNQLRTTDERYGEENQLVTQSGVDHGGHTRRHTFGHVTYPAHSTVTYTVHTRSSSAPSSFGAEAWSQASLLDGCTGVRTSHPVVEKPGPWGSGDKSVHSGTDTIGLGDHTGYTVPSPYRRDGAVWDSRDSVPITSYRRPTLAENKGRSVSLESGVYDRGTVSGISDVSRSEAGFLDGLSRYGRREPWALGASRYRCPGSLVPVEDRCTTDTPNRFQANHVDTESRRNYTTLPDQFQRAPLNVMTRGPVVGPVQEHKPPTFDGKTDLDSFITQFELTANMNNWPKRIKAFKLAVSLKDAASEVLNNLSRDERYDYDVIVEALYNRFQPRNQTRLHVTKLKSRYRKRNESLEDLSFDIQKMVRYAYPSGDQKFRDEMALECFAEALNDEQLQRNLIIASPQTMSDAVKIAMECELALPRHHVRVVKEEAQDESLEYLKQRVDELQWKYGNHA